MAESHDYFSPMQGIGGKRFNGQTALKVQFNLSFQDAVYSVHIQPNALHWAEVIFPFRE